MPITSVSLQSRSSKVNKFFESISYGLSVTLNTIYVYKCHNKTSLNLLSPADLSETGWGDDMTLKILAIPLENPLKDIKKCRIDSFQ